MKLHKSPNANFKLLSILVAGIAIIIISKGKALFTGLIIICLSALLLVINAKFEEFIDEKEAEEAEKEYCEFVPLPIYSVQQEKMTNGILAIMVAILVIFGISAVALIIVLITKYHVENIKGFYGGVLFLPFSICYMLFLGLKKVRNEEVKRKELVDGVIGMLVGILFFADTLYDVIKIISK